MSLKPPKKSDLGKSWMKPRRDKNILICPEYHLIVTEGTETEPQYFEAIRTIINSQYRDKIQLDIHGAGDNTLSLLDKAMNLVMNNPNGYKHVWIVYDTDDFPAKRINKTNELCINMSTEETQYHAIWLKNIGQGEYSKGRADMFQILRPFMDFAITNAERLDAMNEGKTPASSAPGTKVHELIKHLRPYLKIG